MSSETDFLASFGLDFENSDLTMVGREKCWEGKKTEWRCDTELN